MLKGTHVTTTTPRPEYPRPDRDRSAAWVSLNGTWDLIAEGAVQPVVVPFAWETAASGVRRTWLERATYRRSIRSPWPAEQARTFLCFGAVHHHAVVRLDGEVVGEHRGGHTPFELDVTEALAAGQDVLLEVEVEAPQDKRSIPHGKQRSIPRDDYDGVSFTPTSGIWQSVWLERRGRTWADAVAVRGDSLTALAVTGVLRGDAAGRGVVDVVVADGDRTVASRRVTAQGDGSFALDVPLVDPRTWSPADPHLYWVTVTAGDGEVRDEVVVTAGLRRVEVRGEQLFLNGERLYVRGVLDQGYWPETGLTAPDDAALVRDLELARDLGYNLVRKHIKLEEPRWLHHADRMGMLVWAEPPAHSRSSSEAAEAFEEQIAPMVERDGNHPSIVVWGLYNEEWGLDWDIPGEPANADFAARAYDRLRALDDTRPVVENSGWAHVRSDLVDWHYYDEDPAVWASTVADLASGAREAFPVKLGPDFVVDKSFYGSPDFPRTGVPILNSEYGGGFTSLERAWHLRWQTQELRRHDRFAGYVYTELTDVEHEMAGIVDADRRPKDHGGLRATQPNADTVLVVDLVPARAGADVPMPDGPWDLAVHVSHHGTGATVGAVAAAWLASGTPTPDEPPAGAVASEQLKADPFELSPAVVVPVPAPPAGTAARLHLWWVEADGRAIASTFVDAGPIETPNRRGARPGSDA